MLTTVRAPPVDRPVPRGQLDVPGEAMTDVLSIHDFLWTFHEALRLSRMSLEDFAAALQCKTEIVCDCEKMCVSAMAQFSVSGPDMEVGQGRRKVPCLRWRIVYPAARQLWRVLRVHGVWCRRVFGAREVI